MKGEFSPEQKKVIDEYVKYQLARRKLDQAKIAKLPDGEAVLRRLSIVRSGRTEPCRRTEWD